MSAAMKMEYTPIPLATVFDVDAIVNISYYKLENGYVFSGESHFFWEFIYVDRGSIVVTAGADKYFLKAGWRFTARMSFIRSSRSAQVT